VADWYATNPEVRPAAALSGATKIRRIAIQGFGWSGNEREKRRRTIGFVWGFRVMRAKLKRLEELAGDISTPGCG
jgi:hypothetical protein